MIFISFSWKKEDKEVVDKIYQTLSKKYGEDKVFLNNETEGSNNYWINIEKGLRNCSYFIFFNSNNYKKSSSCGNELLIALELQSKIKILEIKLNPNITSHPSIMSNTFLDHVNELETSNKIIQSIDNQDFSVFKIENIFNPLEYIHNKEDDNFQIIFNVNKQVINPIFIILYLDKELLLEFDFGQMATLDEGNFLAKDGTQFKMKRFSHSCTLHMNKDYKINVNQISNIKDKALFFLHISNKGNPDSINNYEMIYEITHTKAMN